MQPDMVKKSGFDISWSTTGFVNTCDNIVLV